MKNISDANKCPHCGCPNQEGTTTCGHCKLPIKWESVPVCVSDDEAIACSHCNKVVKNTEEAIKQGWEPDYWDLRDGSKEGVYVGRPTCPECIIALGIVEEDSGERVLRSTSPTQPAILKP